MISEVLGLPALEFCACLLSCIYGYKYSAVGPEKQILLCFPMNYNTYFSACQALFNVLLFFLEIQPF